ncbi:cytochrome c family protein [Asticcacaulis sp. SL142]|jgi:cytochrome c|uniref:c-type cytochrome n=1 Tax=Asticcacaulis sp. SL142 TaxID=2995155 RepID=UPI00226D0EF5|nr:cytochrome c family protein [Asticcacaulis sp. SL142]WAC47712.1 cytochrome c family protein [Asticcacaulis sp. SL142]
MSGDLKLNMIMGAGLAAALAIMGVRIGADALYHTEAPEKPGYLIEVAEVAEGGEAAGPEILPDWGTVLATADLAAGEAQFKKCMSCHQVTDANGTGPGLNGIVGRPTAAHAGFAYSDAMKAHAGPAPNWTYDELYHFLGAPGKWVKGTKMAFAGIKKPEDRVNLIAWLKTHGSAGYAVPAPDPTRQPGAATTAAAPVEGAPATAPAETPAATAATPAATPAA